MFPDRVSTRTTIIIQVLAVLSVISLLPWSLRSGPGQQESVTMAPVLLDGPFLGSGGVHQLVVSHRLDMVNRLRLLSAIRHSFSRIMMSTRCLLDNNFLIVIV